MAWERSQINVENYHPLPTEHGLYAALTPTPSTSAVLKVVCWTWEDHLWALVGIACEERLSLRLASITCECFWESGLGALEGGASGAADGVVPLNSDEGEEWEDDVMKMLEGLSGVQVAEGAPADHPYHISQLHIILDRTDELLEAFTNGLQEELPQVSPFATQIILEAYLRVLEHAGQRELIAMYAGALSDNTIESYALFFTSLELAGVATERRLALTCTREPGLDIERVAIVTAERTIEKTFTILPPEKGPLPSIIGLEPAPTDAEILLLRSIEWTTFLESTYDTALEPVNIILRYFLGRVWIQLLLDMLPPELGSLMEPKDQVTEYMHYRQFFNVLEQPQMNKDTRAAWLSDYKVRMCRCWCAMNGCAERGIHLSPSRSPFRSAHCIPSNSSMSSAPTITPSLFIRGQAATTISTTPEVGCSPANSYEPPPFLERYPKLFFTSAKTGDSVKDMFEYIAQHVGARQEYEEVLEARMMHVQEASQGNSIHLSGFPPDRRLGRITGSCCGT
ncbi:hypothetical protein LXA43DRAFT_1159845 [Ganoderma leucocontextum]|nr:hypothetical protein LXA43DRAFT_1159845 [Ganoderma leucocontextum]